MLARVDAGFLARSGAWHALVVARNTAFLAGDAALARGDERRHRPAGPDRRRRVATVRPVPRRVRDPELGLVPRRAPGRGRAVGRGRPRPFPRRRPRVLGRAGHAVGAAVERARHRADRGGRVARHRRGLRRVVGGARRDRAARRARCGSSSCCRSSSWATSRARSASSRARPRSPSSSWRCSTWWSRSGWHTGLVRFEDVMLGAGVSAAVALLFWPRRLEPLVARLMAEVSAAAGALLAGTAARGHGADDRRRPRTDGRRPRPGRAPRSSSCSTSTGADPSSRSRTWPGSAWRCTPGPPPTPSCGCRSSCRARSRRRPTPRSSRSATSSPTPRRSSRRTGAGAGHADRPRAPRARGVDPGRRGRRRSPPRTATHRSSCARSWPATGSSRVAQMVDHRP